MSSRIVIALGLVLFALIWGLQISSPAYAAVSATEPTLWARSVSWIMAQQRAFHQDLSSALNALADNGGIASAGSLILGSFLYGVFHAAGPGHGKAILTTYLLTHPHRIKRGVSIAAASAFCQGLVAIILVYGLIYLAGWLPRETSSAIAWSERLSYFLVAAIGALLILRTLRQIVIRFLPGKQATSLHLHDHSHDHGGCDDCGHHHMPSGEQLERIHDLRSAVSVVLAIGLRPCTGAILVLVLAKALSLPFAGVGAVIAMSAGTGMAVALIAFLAVSARQKASSMTAGRSAFWQLAGNSLTLAGGGLLLAIGISLLSASFYSRHPLGL